MPFLLAVIVGLMATSCVTILDAVFKTEEEDAVIVCVASSSYSIDVTIDKNQYHIKTVKEKDLNRKRNLKHAADNMIYLSPGSHKVLIKKNGRTIYDQKIHLSSDETKLIYL